MQEVEKVYTVTVCSDCLRFMCEHRESQPCDGAAFAERTFASLQEHRDASAKARVRQLEKRAETAVETLRNATDKESVGYTYNSGRDGATLRAMMHTAVLLGGESLESFVRCVEALVRMKAVLRYDASPLSLCWSGCNMYGGFIFHRSDRTWELHS
jgi:hypothetical protein